MKRRLSLRGRGVQLLSQREHSRQELRRKLLQHLRKLHSEAESGLPEPIEPTEPIDADQQVDDVLTWLQDKGYFSEQRFVESRVHVREGRYGNLRIRQELAQHGVALDADTTARLKDSELARAHEVWLRKFGAPAAEAAGRAKQMRFLSSRGFSPEVIRRVVKGGAEVEGDDG
ncbi:RecX family transcriptional regulator [Rhizobacter sp. OV335]|uniref:RecX family transcriptional regulator n=1 Tax=Rhizobacter sp. OV335 TaxID=1500264 RepID=UPI0009139B0A|nr:regulatory protein [Rhizobacter sp. OV335]